jgi:tRNA (cmo5U34)-methyltransferase
MSDAQFHFDPHTYEAMISSEVPAYWRLQDAVAAAVSGRRAFTVLDLGTGTGVTAQHVLAVRPDARLVGVDESAAMLAAARAVLPRDADLRVGRLEDPLPAGPFDLVVSALAIHHLDGPGKADLFQRIADVVAPGGRFVLGDVIVPDDPGDVVTPIDDEYDRPSSIGDQLAWLEAAGLVATAVWVERDLAVIVADRRAS